VVCAEANKILRPDMKIVIPEEGSPDYSWCIGTGPSSLPRKNLKSLMELDQHMPIPCDGIYVYDVTSHNYPEGGYWKFNVEPCSCTYYLWTLADYEDDRLQEVPVVVSGEIDYNDFV